MVLEKTGKNQIAAVSDELLLILEDISMGIKHWDTVAVLHSWSEGVKADWLQMKTDKACWESWLAFQKKVELWVVHSQSVASSWKTVCDHAAGQSVSLTRSSFKDSLVRFWKCCEYRAAIGEVILAAMDVKSLRESRCLAGTAVVPDDILFTTVLSITKTLDNVDALNQIQNKYHDEVWHASGALPVDKEVITTTSSAMSTWLQLQQREIYNESIAAFLGGCLASKDADLALPKGNFLTEGDFIKTVATKTVRPASAVSRMAQRMGKTQDHIICIAVEKLELARSAAAKLAQCRCPELPGERLPTAESFSALTITQSQQKQLPRLQAFAAASSELDSFMSQNKVADFNFHDLDSPFGRYVAMFE